MIVRDGTNSKGFLKLFCPFIPSSVRVMRGGLVLLAVLGGLGLGVQSIPVLSTIAALIPFPDSVPVTASRGGVDAQGHTTFVVVDPERTTVTETEVIGTDYYSWHVSQPAAGLFGIEVCTRTGDPSLGPSAYQCEGAFGAGAQLAPTTIPTQVWGTQVVDIDVTETFTHTQPTSSTEQGSSTASTGQISAVSGTRNSDSSVPLSTSSTNPTSSSSPSSSSSASTSGSDLTPTTRQKKKSHAGPIAGGVIGGLALIAILALLFWRCRRSRTRSVASDPSTSWETQPTPFVPDSEKLPQPTTMGYLASDSINATYAGSESTAAIRLAPNRPGDSPTPPSFISSPPSSHSPLSSVAPSSTAAAPDPNTAMLLHEMQSMRAEMERMRVEQGLDEPPPRYASGM
ncbi:hypothetical protein C8F01DRAFT_1306358 [Mycena amicta]|nr:hypothetical protein C8F01DRAFT_1306358 [Mycena amicta]